MLASKRNFAFGVRLSGMARSSCFGYGWKRKWKSLVQLKRRNPTVGARFLAALAFGLVCGGALAEEDWETPDWKPVADLRRTEDKAIADAVFPGTCIDGDRMSEVACGSRRAALVSVGGATDFLLLESYSMGTCGDYDIVVYGPIGSGHRRPDRPEFEYCANALKYRPQQRQSSIPDFLLSGLRIGSAIGGASGWVFEDVLLRYHGGTWSETAIMAIQSPPG